LKIEFVTHTKFVKVKILVVVCNGIYTISCVQ